MVVVARGGAVGSDDAAAADRPGDRPAAAEALAHVLERWSSAVLLVAPVGLATVEDGYGRAAADVCRAAVAEHCAEVFGPGLLGEHLRDQLLVVVPATGEDPAAAAHRALERLGRDVRVRLPGEDRVVAVLRLVVGGVVAGPAGDVTAAVASAGAALRAAHRGERNVVLGRDADGAQAAARRRLRLGTDLAEHVFRPDLRLAYQPIVDLVTGELLKVEALLRWRHPDLGFVPPPEVIAVAAEAGLTRVLTESLATRVAADAEGWRNATGRPLPVSFNLSADQLATVPPAVLLDLFAGGVLPEDLTLEVTEESIPADIDEAVALLEQYRSAGASIAIDDFGAGYASIGYLRRLPADIVKLDREFIEELGTWSVDGSHAEVVQDLVRGFGLRTIAEGIETMAQLEVVTRMGAEYGQGWLFGRAVPMAELLASPFAVPGR